MASDGSNVNLCEGHVSRKGGRVDQHTFINAFESSPVHWLKSRPSGKRRKPGYMGTAEILEVVRSYYGNLNLRMQLTDGQCHPGSVLQQQHHECIQGSLLPTKPNDP